VVEGCVGLSVAASVEAVEVPPVSRNGLVG